MKVTLAQRLVAVKRVYRGFCVVTAAVQPDPSENMHPALIILF